MSEEKKKNWFARHKVITILIILFCIGTIGSFGGGVSNNNDTTKKQQETKKDKNNINIGDMGFVRLPNIDDKEQVICIVKDKQDYDEYSKIMIAQDTYGLLELAKKDKIFCVGNGAKIKLLEKSFGLRKVRIMEGVNEVDADKVGQSGWLVMEWVVNE